jgi:hypothetical protein
VDSFKQGTVRSALPLLVETFAFFFWLLFFALNSHCLELQ